MPPARVLIRLPDWAQRLNALVLARLGQPFAWGSNDCVAFVADALQAMHGRDLMAEFRTQRGSALQATRQLRAGGGMDAGLQRAGLVRVPTAMAAVGDVVWLRQGRRPVLALCNGADALAPGRLGLECLPMARAVAAWRT